MRSPSYGDSNGWSRTSLKISTIWTIHMIRIINKISMILMITKIIMKNIISMIGTLSWNEIPAWETGPTMWFDKLCQLTLISAWDAYKRAHLKGDLLAYIFAAVEVVAWRRGSPRMDAQGQKNQAPYGPLPPPATAFDTQWTHSHDCGHARCTPLTHPQHCPATRIKLSHQLLLTKTGLCQEQGVVLWRTKV